MCKLIKLLLWPRSVNDHSHEWAPKGWEMQRGNTLMGRAGSGATRHYSPATLIVYLQALLFSLAALMLFICIHVHCKTQVYDNPFIPKAHKLLRRIS